MALLAAAEAGTDAAGTEDLGEVHEIAAPEAEGPDGAVPEEAVATGMDPQALAADDAADPLVAAGGAGAAGPADEAAAAVSPPACPVAPQCAECGNVFATARGLRARSCPQEACISMCGVVDLPGVR